MVRTKGGGVCSPKVSTAEHDMNLPTFPTDNLEAILKLQIFIVSPSCGPLSVTTSVKVQGGACESVSLIPVPGVLASVGCELTLCASYDTLFPGWRGLGICDGPQESGYGLNLRYSRIPKA